MRWRADKNNERWHRWFAWRPVELINGDWVWLETVTRKWVPYARPIMGYAHVTYGRWEYV